MGKGGSRAPVVAKIKRQHGSLRRGSKGQLDRALVSNRVPAQVDAEAGVFFSQSLCEAARLVVPELSERKDERI